MNKKWMALAMAAAAGTASAQSSVSLAGIVDTGVTWGRGSVADRFQVTSGNYSTSRFIFRGTEDLGGGQAASFWLEAGFNADDGSGQASNTNNQASGAGPSLGGGQGFTFGRRSTVSVSGRWGEVRLGRDYVPQYWNRSNFDPFTSVGVGQSTIHTLAITGNTSVRASNSVGYLLPSNLGGVYGQVMYHAGENLSSAGATKRDGSGYGVRIGWSGGPVNVAAATGYTRLAAGSVHQSNIGARWDLPLVKVVALYERQSAGARDADGWLIGGFVPVGAGEIRASYSRFHIDPPGTGAEPLARKLAVGYVHHLSKRTALYGTYARVRNRDGSTLALGGSSTAANQNSSGLDLGVRHSF